MRHRRFVLGLAGLLVLFLGATDTAWAENWGGWRGPRGDGVSLEKNLPLQWNGATGQNVIWKASLPGQGHASPIVWQDRLFVVSCLKEAEERVLLCLDAQTGETIWQRVVLKSKLETKHALNSYASGTPATDGQYVYVAFLEVDGHTIPAPNVSNVRPVTPGKIVVAAYDYSGQERWKVRVGDFVSAHGFCSCPVLYQDLVIINGDHDGDSYLVALERQSGKIRWKVDREHKTRSYATPLIRKIDGRTQMVLSGSKSVVSYDPLSGKPYWTIDGPTEQFVASMVYDGRLFFLTAGFPDHHILAIRPDGTGNVTDTHIVWRTQRGAAYVPSPVVSGQYLLVVSDGGVASCFDTASGERYWMNRLGPQYSASPVVVEGNVYLTSDEGVTTVIQPARSFTRLAENPLGERCSSSAAVSGGRLFLRGVEHLYCIGK